MSSSTQLDNEINKYQDDFISHLRQIERQELEIALNEAEKSEKRLFLKSYNFTRHSYE